MVYRKFTHAQYLSIEDPTINVPERARYIRSIGGLRLTQYKDAVARLVHQPNGDESGILFMDSIYCLLVQLGDAEYFDLAERRTRAGKLVVGVIATYALTSGDKVPETISALLAVMNLESSDTAKIADCYRRILMLLDDRRPVPFYLSRDDPSIDWALLAPYLPT